MTSLTLLTHLLSQPYLFFRVFLLPENEVEDDEGEDGFQNEMVGRSLEPTTTK
jgi:hypothetical protein